MTHEPGISAAGNAAAPVLMVLGTASSVGKSVMVTALCRILHQDGVRVVPFKAQNMSNNADVTADGLEIGRAQSEQAAAAGLAPRVEMNPVLLKPQGDRTSHVVLDGRPAGTLHSRDFLEGRHRFWASVTRSLSVLREEFELVIAEGAGSPSEPNLKATDIVNMGLARHAGASVLIVGDIDRGGVFAHLVGTLELLDADEHALVRGFVINRFRGDPSLLAPAIEDLEGRTRVPVLGVVPWINDLRIAEEDAVALERGERRASERGDAGRSVDIAVVRLPRIANFDDFDPLARDPGVTLRYVERAAEMGMPDLIVLPGTKATIDDLRAMRDAGLDDAILARAELGAIVLGICGGFKMLGETILDEHGVEAAAGTQVPGLGLLPQTTTFSRTKETQRSRGTVEAGAGAWSSTVGLEVSGYQIHMGSTEWLSDVAGEPFLTLDGEPDGAMSADGRVAGTYLHGLFHNDAVRHALLRGLGWSEAAEVSQSDRAREAEFDRVAEIVRTHLDIPRIRAMVGLEADPE